MAKFQELTEFVIRATKNRKYPENTAQSLRAAIKLYSDGLNEDERNSLAKVKENFEQITQSVFAKNASKFTAASLATYKSRALKVISDFEKYNDPAKMNGWNPPVVTRSKKPEGTKKIKNSSEKNLQTDEVVSPTMHRIELALRPDAKTVLIVPKDMTEAEYAIIAAILKSLSMK